MIALTGIKKRLQKNASHALMNLAMAGSAFGITQASEIEHQEDRESQGDKNRLFIDHETSLNSIAQLYHHKKTKQDKLKKAKTTKKSSDLGIQKLGSVQELFIIDGAVQDKEVLLQSINRPGAGIAVIDKGGIVKLTNILARHQNLKAVHLISHAEAGRLQIGNESISKSRLKADPRIVEALDEAMIEGGDLLLYGCELAKDKEGEELLEILSSSAHIDVAASNDLTGNTEFNGDWELEITTGDIEAEPISDSPALKDFTNVLQTVVPASNGSYGYSATNSTSMAGGYTLILTPIVGIGMYNQGAAMGGYVGTQGFGSGGGTTTTRITIVDGSGGPATFNLTSGIFGAGGNTHGVSATVSGATAGSGTIPNMTSGSQTINFSGFVNQTHVDIVTSGRSQLLFQSLTFTNVTAGGGASDTTPPAFENSTPATSAITSSGVTLSTDIDEEGTIYYVVLADGASAPTSQQIIDGTGPAASPVANGSQVVNSGNFDHDFAITGLNAGVPYDIYVVAQDDESTPNVQANPELREITTNPIEWDGSTDNDWDTAANWDSNSVPSSGDNVIIPTGLTNYPTATGLKTVSSLNIASGATVIAKDGLNGTITYTRALGTNNWYLVSFPVSGETVQDLRGANSFAQSGSNMGIAFYDTSGSAWSYYQTGATGGLTDGRGYSVKLSAAGDLTATGAFISTDQNVTLVNSGNKFNLLGNPFISFINGATFLTNETADLASQTVWLWNQATGSNGAYDTFTPGANPNFKIAPGQGFWVEANTTNSVAFTESLQSHESTDTFQKTAPRPEIYVHITDQDGLERKTRILYDENATQGFDNGYDGKLFGGASHTFTVFTQLLAQNQGEKYAVQVLPNADYETQIIPIGIIAEKGKQITFSAEALNLPEGIQVYLEDRENNSITELGEENSNGTYQVILNKDTNGTGRFYLYTRNGVLSTNDLNSLSGVSIFNTDKNTLNISGVNSQNAHLQIYNVLGKEILNTNFSSTGSTEITLPKVSTGIYVVHLGTEKGKMTKKIVLE